MSTNVARFGKALASWLRYFVQARGSRRRCDHCGRLKHFDDAWHGYGNDRVWHSECMSYRHWRSKADERMRVLRAVVEAWNVTTADVVVLLGIPVSPEHLDHATPRSAEEINLDNLAFRVFYDLKKKR